MIKVPFAIGAGLVLLYLGFYVLPGSLWASDTLDSKQRCNDEILAAVQQRAEGKRPDKGQPDACKELLGQAKVADAIAH